MYARRLPFLYAVLTVAQAAHSLEEYVADLVDWFPVVTGSLHRLTGVIPVVAMSPQTFAWLNLTLILGLVALIPFAFRRHERWVLRAITVIALVEVGNGLIHLAAALVVGGYFPGSITAVVLLGAGGAVIRTLRMDRRM